MSLGVSRFHGSAAKPRVDPLAAAVAAAVATALVTPPPPSAAPAPPSPSTTGAAVPPSSPPPSVFRRMTGLFSGGSGTPPPPPRSPSPPPALPTPPPTTTLTGGGSASVSGSGAGGGATATTMIGATGDASPIIPRTSMDFAPEWTTRRWGDEYGGNGDAAQTTQALKKIREYEETARLMIAIGEDDALLRVKTFVATIESGVRKAGNAADWTLMLVGEGGVLAKSDPWKFIQIFCERVAVACDGTWDAFVSLCDRNPNVTRNDVIRHDRAWRVWARMSMMSASDTSLTRGAPVFVRAAAYRIAGLTAAQEAPNLRVLHEIGWRSVPYNPALFRGGNDLNATRLPPYSSDYNRDRFLEENPGLVQQFREFTTPSIDYRLPLSRTF